MSPRPYSMQKRKAGAAETRNRILEAAHQLLSSDAAGDLGMEAIARNAGVSRLTIYYQFESRAGLMEALYDRLAQRGNMQRMAEVFHEPDSALALDTMVRTFIGFWASDPVVIRRLRAMAGLDGEIAQGIRARDARRPQIAREVLKRRVNRATKQRDDSERAVADLIGMLTSFESYDALARAGHSEQTIIAMVTHLVRCASTLSTTTKRERRRDAARAPRRQITRHE